MTETTVTIADLRKVQTDAEAALAKSKTEFEAFGQLSTVDLLAKLDEVSAAKGAIERNVKAVERAKADIAEFEANANFEKLSPMRDALKTWLRDNANKLPSNTVVGAFIDISMSDDGTLTIEPKIAYEMPSLDTIKSEIASTLAPHRQLMRANHVDHLFGQLVGIGKANMEINVGRVAPKAAKSTTSKPRATSDGKRDLVGVFEANATQEEKDLLSQAHGNGNAEYALRLKVWKRVNG